MGVICNGLQKSGVHLLQRIVYLTNSLRIAPDKLVRPMTKTQSRDAPYGPGFCELDKDEVAYTHVPYPADIGNHTSGGPELITAFGYGGKCG